jgi:nucleoside triphosphate pyrophosphatase
MTPKSSSSQIILASTSRARREMLAAAGVAFTVEAADVDEPAIRKKLLAGKPPATPQQIAEALARAKAEDVSRRHKGSLVIGGDQVLALGNELLTKARDEAAARATLGKLKGKTHELHSAVALAADGKVLWAHTGTARLKMRDFSDGFLDEYLTRAGDRIQQSVGAYELEGLGVQLFETIAGDYFTILGLPLMELLAELRAREMIPA